MELVFARLLPCMSIAVFLVGVGWRLVRWMRTPVPFHLTLFPVPQDVIGKIKFLGAEIFSSRTLYKHDKKLWFPTVIFHASLVMILGGHLLGIYFLREQFVFVGMTPEASRLTSQALGGAAGFFMTGSLVLLICRRVTASNVKKLSDPDSYISLFLVMSIALSGMLMYFPGFHADLPSVRTYLGGLFKAGPLSVPHNVPFVIHLTLGAILLVHLPFSRMLHSIGFFVTRTMLFEKPPVYPTPPGLRQRSPFAAKKVTPDIPVPRKHIGDERGTAG